MPFAVKRWSSIWFALPGARIAEETASSDPDQYMDAAAGGHYDDAQEAA
jgi:hypothetical protein